MGDAVAGHGGADGDGRAGVRAVRADGRELERGLDGDGGTAAEGEVPDVAGGGRSEIPLRTWKGESQRNASMLLVITRDVVGGVSSLPQDMRAFRWS